MSEDSDRPPPRACSDHGEALAVLLERTSKLETRFVRRHEFEPVQKVVYGLVGLVLVSVFTGFLGLLLTRSVHP